MKTQSKQEKLDSLNRWLKNTTGFPGNLNKPGKSHLTRGGKKNRKQIGGN
jgi:hypothetical protein